MSEILRAAMYAEQKHAGQKRKDGKPYFTHVAAVADIVNMEWFTLIPRQAQDNWNKHKDHVVAAAYLHDVIEDCGVTKQDLLDAGFSVMTAEIVDALSKKPGENYFDFIMRIHDGGPFRTGMVAVKLADLQHNMSDLNEGSLKDKYRLAHYILSYFNPKKMTTTDYVPVDALKCRIDVIRDYYQDLLNTCVKHGNSSGEYTYQGVLEALNELEREIDEMKVSL